MPEFTTEATAARYRNEKKTVGLGYMVWFWFGFFGGHRFYLRSVPLALAQVALGIVGFPCLIALMTGADFSSGTAVILVLLMAPMIVFWIFDATRLPALVELANQKIAAGLQKQEAGVSIR